MPIFLEFHNRSADSASIRSATLGALLSQFLQGLLKQLAKLLLPESLRQMHEHRVVHLAPNIDHFVELGFLHVSYSHSLSELVGVCQLRFMHEVAGDTLLDRIESEIQLQAAGIVLTANDAVRV